MTTKLKLVSNRVGGCIGTFLLVLLLAVVYSAAAAHAQTETHPGGRSGMQMPGMQMPGAPAPTTGAVSEAPSQVGADQMPGAVELTPRKQQISGVRTGRVEERQLVHVIRTVGLLQADETKIRHIHTKVSGWIQKLSLNFTGQLVKRGAPMLSIYSPDLVSTQVEYLLALKEQRWLKESPYPEAPAGANALLNATRQRLLFWDVTPGQIRELEERGQPEKALVLHSPINGYVTFKEIYEGMYISPEMELYTITDLSALWTYLDIYEYELPLIKVGQEVLLSLSYFPGQAFRGKVAYVYPILDPQTRTAKIRVELANAQYKLKPDMYATAEVRVDLGRRLAVPEDAVLDSGTEQFVFQVAGEGHFEPRRVTLGTRAEGYYEVLAGLSPGMEVVTSANFLVDSESRLKAAMGAMEGHGAMQQTAAQSEVAPTAAKATVEMTTEPSAPSQGKNRVLVTLRDTKGAPVTGADVSLIFFMPGMPSMGMPSVRHQAKAPEQGNGIYATNVDLESGGTWQVTITASKAGSVIATKQMELSVSGGM